MASLKEPFASQEHQLLLKVVHLSEGAYSVRALPEQLAYSVRVLLLVEEACLQQLAPVLA